MCGDHHATFSIPLELPFCASWRSPRRQLRRRARFLRWRARNAPLLIFDRFDLLLLSVFKYATSLPLAPADATVNVPWIAHARYPLRGILLHFPHHHLPFA